MTGGGGWATGGGARISWAGGGAWLGFGGGGTVCVISVYGENGRKSGNVAKIVYTFF